MRLRYDVLCDVLYVKSRPAKTVNVSISPDEVLCVDPEALEVVGSIHTNFSLHYPKILKLLKEVSNTAKEGTGEFLELFLRELNVSLLVFRSTKVLLDFLKHERVGFRTRIPA